MRLSLEQIAYWSGAELLGPHAGHAESYSIDSRTLTPGALFVAIVGERFDGHTFVDTAFERGAVAAVVARHALHALSQEARQKPLLVVEDTLKALQQLAEAVRKHWGKRVIGITGSAGKTTTKEAIAQVLATRYRVLKSQGNLNNGFGLPLQLLRLEMSDEVAVIEMGMSSAGEIAALSAIALPDWGVVTNVGNAHAEFFPDGIAGIARAKYELVQSLPAHGTAFLNCDDHYVSQFGREFSGKVRYFGRGVCADPKAESIEVLGSDGLKMIVHAGEERAPLHLHLLGEHNVTNAMAAVAVGLEAGIPLLECCAALEGLMPDEKRGGVVHWQGATIINDSYNSNPEALRAMIGTLAAMPVAEGGRRILVAGEMLELGAESAALHERCGKAAAQAHLNVVVGVRGDARYIVDAASHAGVQAVYVENAQQAGEWLRSALQPGDAVLLKASRGVRLEQALDVLKG